VCSGQTPVVNTAPPSTAQRLRSTFLQRTPPDAVLTYDLTDNSRASIYTPFAGTNFLERHYEKVLENSAGHLWVRQR